jgi:hypothetical protein
MDRSSLQPLQIIRRAAATGLRQMNDRFQMVMSSLPSLRDAFDSDELPVEFILRRDSSSEPVARHAKPVPSGARSLMPKGSAHDVEHRWGQRKPASDE